MIGADTGGLRQLGGDMRRSAQQLEGVASSLRNAPRNVWLGSDAASFFSNVDSSLLPQLRAVIEALVNAGAVLERNAAAQDETSATLAGADGGVVAVGGGVVTGFVPSEMLAGVGRAVLDGGSFLADALGLGMTTAQWALTDPGVKEWWKTDIPGGNALSLFSAVLTGVDVGVQAAEGNWGQAAWSGVKGALGQVPGAVGLAAPAAMELFEMAVPFSDERSEAVYEALKMRQYGTTDLTYEQAAALSDRYNLPAGPLYMIKDSFDESMENPQGFTATGIKVVGEGIADVIWGGYELMTGKR